MKEKKEEMVNKMDKKISEYIKLKIDETTERKEFEQYVKINQAERKEDEYGILRAIRHISYHSIFRTNEYEVLRERNLDVFQFLIARPRKQEQEVKGVGKGLSTVVLDPAWFVCE